MRIEFSHRVLDQFPDPYLGLRVCVTGGRRYSDYQAVADVLAALEPRRIVQGGAPGADALAREWAHRQGVTYVTVPARWDREGRAAGRRRNRRILAEEEFDIGVAFPGGPGTADMSRLIVDSGRVLFVVEGSRVRVQNLRMSR